MAEEEEENVEEALEEATEDVGGGVAEVMEEAEEVEVGFAVEEKVEEGIAEVDEMGVGVAEEDEDDVVVGGGGVIVGEVVVNVDVLGAVVGAGDVRPPYTQSGPRGIYTRVLVTNRCFVHKKLTLGP
jgi:hypothetical protein